MKIKNFKLKITKLLSYLTPNTWLKRARLEKKLYYYTIIGLLLLIGGGTFLWQMVHPSGVAAAWFNEQWLYRKEIVITAHTSAESNVYLNLSSGNALDTSDSTKFQSDCGDLRFTDKAGNLLPYYVVSGCGSGTTVIHVFFDNFPAGAQSVYYYYGNPAAANGFSAADFASPSSGVSFGTLGSEENSPAPAAYWSFDEGTGTVAKDHTGNSKDGTLTGSTLPVWHANQCVTGKCLYFNGITSNVSVTGTVAGVKSIAFWINPSASATAEIMKLNATTDVRSSGIVTAPGTTSPTIYINATQSAALQPNRWQYVVVTTGTAVSASAITLGKGPLGVLKGYLDEVKFYPFVLSSAQIQANYNSRSSRQGSAAVMGAKDQAFLSDGLVGYWKLDESSYTSDCSTATATDSSGNGNDAISCPNGGALVASPAAKFGKSAYFNGVSSQYVQSTPSKTNRRYATEAAWVNFDDPDTVNIVDVYHHLFGWDIEFWITYRSGAGVANFLWLKGTEEGGGTNALSFTYILPTRLSGWHHVAATYGPEKARMYLDGELVGSQNVSKTSLMVTAATRTFRIGGDPEQGYYFDGNIDDVRLYYRELSGQEIRFLYNFSPRSQGYYNFEEGQGSTVNDISGSGNNGTWSGTNRRWTQGKYGKGGSFDGSSNYVDTNTLYSFTQQQSFSVAAWVKSSFLDPSGTNTYSIVSKGCGFIGTYALWYRATTTAATAMFCIHDASATQVSASNTSGTNLADNKWHYLTGVRDTYADKLYIYVDGVLQNSTTDTTTADFARASNVLIGARGFDALEKFTGSIDEAKIFDYALTQKQVVENMNGGHPAGGSPVGSQIGWWKFDAGSGNVASNSGTLGGLAHGQMINFASPPSQTSGWSNDGRLNKALNFDSSDDVVEAGSDAAVDDLAEFSVSGWFNPRSAGEGNSGTLFDKSNSSAGVNGWQVYLLSTRVIVLNIDYSGTDLHVITTNALPLNTWSHVMLTWNGSSTATNVHIYINGKEVAYSTQTNGTSSRVSDAVSLFRVGNEKTRTFTWDGWIDEVKLYNYVLSKDDVTLDMNRGSSVQWGGLGINPSDGVSASGSANTSYCVPGDTSTLSCQPIGEWGFEEGRGGNVTDSSRNGYTGSWTGTSKYVQGKFGKAGQFDGSTNYVTTGNTFSFTQSQSFTVAAWVKVLSLGGHIVSKNQGSLNSYGLIIGNSGGKAVPDFSIKDGSTAVDISAFGAGVEIRDNKWHYLVGVRDVTNDVVKLYRDGVLEAQGTDTTTGNFDRSDNVMLGARTAGSDLFTGGIDQAQIYNYALSAPQVAWNYNRGKPMLQYRFDECQGSTVTDVSGNGRTGTININGTGTQTAAGTCTSSGAWFNGAIGKQNASLNFDGTDDYVNVPSPNLPTTDYTYSAWVYPTRVSSTVFMASNGSGGNEFLATVTAASKIQVFNHNATTLTTTNAVSLNTWTHVVVTRSGSTVKVYLNGVLDPTTGTDSNTLSFSTCDLLIGVDSDSSCTGTLGGYFQGKIDEAQVFNYAMTQVQIRNLFNGGAVRFGPLTGSP